MLRIISVVGLYLSSHREYTFTGSCMNVTNIPLHSKNSIPDTPNDLLHEISAEKF